MTPASLDMLTDHERALLLREIAALRGLNYYTCSVADLRKVLNDEREDAEKYKGLCR